MYVMEKTIILLVPQGALEHDLQAPIGQVINILSN